MWWIIGGAVSLVVLIWTFWQVISLLVWRKQNAPAEERWAPNWCRCSRHWLPFKFKPDPELSRSLSNLSTLHNELVVRHKACVKEFTEKLQAICPHAETTIDETEDVASFEIRMCPSRYSPSYNIPRGPYGRKTVETCNLCGKVLEDKFEEYVDQTPPVGGKECS